MKTYRFFALVGILAIILFDQPTVAARMEQAPMEETPNYVVIGAFSVHRNALRFTARAHSELKVNARFEMNANRRLYYVYVLSTDDHSLAIREALRLRQESEFTDTWVYHGPLGKQSDGAIADASGTDINPETRQSMADVKRRDPASSTGSKSTSSAASPTETTPEQSRSLSPSGTAAVAAANETATTPSTAAPAPATVKTEPDNGVEGKRFFFKLIRAMDQTQVEGEVDAIDTERARKMGTYKGNAPVKVSTPANKSGQISLVSEVFGYRKVQHDINYNAPEGEGIAADDQGDIVVPFDLVRLQRGDVAVMYNVFFFKDAAIMRPESRYEVTSLLDMLNENPKYKIKLHGHTNGSAAGKIISMAKDSKNYFSLTDTKEGFGSAKQLSEARAEIIRDFLINNGIDPKRIEIKAWGGKRPLQDKNSTRAQENVRVEVEILEN
ncbi:OmpA family protein [Chryseolinea serpens]|uniref:OmpA family protein n=1 Tax=Chryseolinea serpens TaxID=947013 RepID=A0A1M5NAI6_9BACT|nr:OmpA family protein [Chryseolinea serpens]SHG86003.1 OmpA family protein [Chryseolinea serpens]